jgi:poly(glycerol-phosphate) alpha-glucosyltransferase
MCEPYILGRGRWKKILLDTLFHKRCLYLASAIHALNEHEEKCIRAYLGSACPSTVVIPNGIDLPAKPIERRLGDSRIFLFCGRIDPKKNLEGLLWAWEKSGAGKLGHRLHIGGDASGAYGASIASRAAKLQGVNFLGLLRGGVKDKAFRDAHFGILASHSEGLPMAVLESLSYCSPCLVTSGCRMPQLNQGFGWSVAEEGLAAAISHAINLSESEYVEMSNRARDYVTRTHDWIAIGRDLAALYESTSGN